MPSNFRSRTTYYYTLALKTLVEGAARARAYSHPGLRFVSGEAHAY